MKKFFRARVVMVSGRHIRAFASEVLLAIDVVMICVETVVRPIGVLQRECFCFELMYRLLAMLRDGSPHLIPAAEILNHQHHQCFAELYPTA